MDVVGSEIGQKMRSAIKAKLTELGCYVDDELPDYVMVMVANKRTRAQMEDDLQLFLSENTELFVNWLHTVLKKLQEVTVTTPVVSIEPEKGKEKSSKEKKTKEKKDKTKKGGLKKAKKKDKEKSHRKKEEKKLHKSKKKSKHHGMIRPNIPPLLMNMEKESEPSITDVFAGQILKNHGITIESLKEDKVIEEKVVVKDVKRPIVPIIDPATISSQSEPITDSQSSTNETTAQTPAGTIIAPRDEQIKEMNEIEAKIIGLKQKLTEQLDSMSDDEDFLNIRTEAEELMNDFAEDVFQEISSQAPIATPPTKPKSPTPTPIPAPKPPEIPKEPPRPPKDLTELPQIELKLPKRPVRERLGAREAAKILEAKQKRTESPERFTPDREPDFWGKNKSAKSRLGEHISETKRTSGSEDSDISDSSSKKILSKVSSQQERPRVSCASVVRVRPRPRVAPSSSLLMRAMADAHKSLLNIPPKVDPEPQKVKRAMVLPMRRTVDAQNIVIQVPQTSDGEKLSSEKEKDEYVPSSITKKIINTDYVPSRRGDRTTTRRDDTLIIETINIHNPTVDKDKDTQFIVTMDGFNPNAFLAKKLLTEGLLNEDEVADLPKTPAKSVLKTEDKDDNKEKTKESNIEDKIDIEIEESILDSEEVESKVSGEMKRLSGTSEDSDTIVIIKPEKVADSKLQKRSNDEDNRCNDGKDKIKNEGADKRKSDTVEKRTALTPERTEKTEATNKIETRNSDIEKEASSDESSKNETDDSPPMKKRKASPIVFDVGKKEKEVEKERDRQRTESASSDNHVIVTTVTNASKYDSVPPLSSAERKPAWCRSFPLCRYGAACLFLHPRCKFAAGCTRRGCIYSHDAPSPALASHVVPAANFKTITNSAMAGVCKFYPNCVNPACHFYHPKPCRYGKACVNKLECNFYHHDVPKWRFSV